MNRVLLLIGRSVLTFGLLFGGSRHTTATDQKNVSEDSASVAGIGRIDDGLVALYGFDSTQPHSASDREWKNLAGTGDSLNLRNEMSAAVEAKRDRLVIEKSTLLRTEDAATELIRPIKRAGALTVEVWVTPANTKQAGPARVVTVSLNSGSRNLTLGQEGDRWQARLRTTETSNNGIPELESPSDRVKTELTHLVYTFDRSGWGRLYVDQRLESEQRIGGNLSNWDEDYQLGIANELSGDRPWQGHLHLVAIYDRALRPAEVAQNFRAGPSLAPPTKEELAAARERENGQRFATKIAPLLSTHCLECHDTSTHQGGLDLSVASGLAAGGESGSVIERGSADESLLWQLVESDSMPLDRPALSDEEKTLLKQWIEDGGTFSLERIDPAVYANGTQPQSSFVRRLTVSEYAETVRAVLGVDISEKAESRLPRDLRADGFSNTAYNLSVDLAHVEAYADLAEMIAERADFKKLASKHTKSRELTDENIRKVIEPLARRLLRAPLTEAEDRRYCGISTSVAAAGGNFEEALSYILQAMLQSPRFLYRIERQPAEGPPRPVGDYELASRLSYILWGGPPDETLLELAEDGELDREEVAKQARRMLEDPRALAQSRRFISEWLNLNHLNNLRPGKERFPNWNAQLAADMQQETLAFFEEIVWEQKRPLGDLLNAEVTFLTKRLAEHYRMPEVQQGGHDELKRYDLTDVPSRGGLLTHGSVLTVGGDEASMVTRGLFVMRHLLRGVVRDPPPCVDTTPVPSEPGRTQRAVAESRMADTSCAGCHAKFEPLAFGLEKFDGLGSFHEKDEFGNKLRDDGQVLFPGQAEAVAYESSAELMDQLANSERVKESLTWKVTQFALGRPLGAADAPHVAKIHRQAQENGGTYQSLMTAIVTSDLVMLVRPEST